MEITRLPYSYAFSLSSLTAKSAGDPISLPVRPSHYLYSQMKHIRGVPAPGGRPGYSLNKLRSLDNLIERLRGLKGKTPYKIPSPGDEDSLDAMIRHYQQELKKSLEARIPKFLGNPARDQGLALNLFV